jgi:hypothetical protein
LTEEFPAALALEEFKDLSGLRDQVRSLTIGSLAKTLSPADVPAIDLSKTSEGMVMYFRLQSLMSPQLVAVV